MFASSPLSFSQTFRAYAQQTSHTLFWFPMLRQPLSLLKQTTHIFKPHCFSSLSFSQRVHQADLISVANPHLVSLRDRNTLQCHSISETPLAASASDPRPLDATSAAPAVSVPPKTRKPRMSSKRKASDDSPEEKKAKPPSKKEIAAALAAAAVAAAGDQAGPSTSSVGAAGPLVNPTRVRNLNKKAMGKGPVIYW